MGKVFKIGLTMAGAVSAGAYTSGVLDYLFQVLDAWQKAKDAGDHTVPHHAVSLDIISGASAGGITGAMAALALCSEERNPVFPDKRKDTAYLEKNIFYNAWVNLLQEDMLPHLLDTSDITEQNKVVSLLNSAFIETIASRTITCLPQCSTAPPQYVNPEMELILTLSNLNGFRYDLKFSALGSSTYSMSQHRDYAFFRLGATYKGDGRIPLDLQKDIGIAELQQAAPATGAFPIGLAYRKFVRKRKYILDNPYLVFYKKGTAEIEGFHEDNAEEDYVTYNVDGGMLNNEPFDLTMQLMAAHAPSGKDEKTMELSTSEKDFEATVIMIDPFPSDNKKSIITIDDSTQKELTTTTSGTKKSFKIFPYDLLEVTGQIYKALRSEVLFKGEDIARLFSKEDVSRFMIAPRRRIKKGPSGREEVLDGSIAIACGALDGFAGFFDKRFREHDFFLGKANCQGFLRKHFRVKLVDNQPVNALFREGYSAEAILRFRFQDEDEKKLFNNPAEAPWYIPIIPDLFQGDDRYTETPLPYPTYNMQQFEGHKKQLLQRLYIVGKGIIRNKPLSFIFMLWFFFKKNWLFHQLKLKIEQHFKEWHLT